MCPLTRPRKNDSVNTLIGRGYFFLVFILSFSRASISAFSFNATRRIDASRREDGGLLQSIDSNEHELYALFPLPSVPPLLSWPPEPEVVPEPPPVPPDPEAVPSDPEARPLLPASLEDLLPLPLALEMRLGRAPELAQMLLARLAAMVELLLVNWDLFRSMVDFAGAIISKCCRVATAVLPGYGVSLRLGERAGMPAFFWTEAASSAAYMVLSAGITRVCLP
mmetsp:Transcript_10333/g.26209  ORF Transcript_10333/g.26209 Transcript_10333/m.26209 type:complete len:223 (+) Transcript_10333:691-1359(+)